MTIVQWVNLDKDPAYAQDPDVGSVDRCGPLSIKAMFDKDNIPLNFTVRLVPSGSDNVQYSAAEQLRNTNFKLPNEISGLAAKKEAILEDSVQLPAAGGNKYKLEATDANGNTVESVEIEAKRKLYYQFMHMEDGTGKVSPYPLTQMENHCLKNKVTLTKAGTDKKIAFHKTVGMHDDARYGFRDLGQDVKKEYDLPPHLKKVGCVAVLSGYIATKLQAKTLVRAHTFGAPTGNIKITPSLVLIRGDHYLWHGLDEEDDKSKNWFVDGTIEYQDTTKDGQKTHTFAIDRDKIDIAGTPRSAYGGYKHLSLSVDQNLKSLLASNKGTIVFKINLNIAAGFSGGFSWDPGGAAFITCSTKSWWQDNPPSNSHVIWNHEIGHRMGMVAYGNKNHPANPYFIRKSYLPDAPSTLYGENPKINDKGHQGPHCESGVTYDAAKDEWSGTPGCVLFGATGTATARSPLDYCSECSDIIRKIDLSR
jgi:hypothetical protein